LLLSRAVHNLLLNACEASPAGTAIEMVTGTGEGHGWVDVLDRGSGLPAHLADRIFDPYVSTKNRGSGLGLSLVQDIARQHGGRVTLENRDGGGARARLAVPLASEEGPAPR
jgi:two-component system sensor histidine kinase CreC